MIRIDLEELECLSARVAFLGLSGEEESWEIPLNEENEREVAC